MRRSLAALAACALTVGTAVILPVVGATPALALDNGLELTPAMGWNDWNAFGCEVSASLIEQTAQTIVSSGLKADGYDYVNIDDCWMSKSRSSTGHLVPDPAKFPDGITAVADYVHSLGLKLGIYESAGATTCQGYPGSYGHEQTDADDFASWGVDYVKYDNCGTTAATSSTQAEYVARYTAMQQAIASSGRNMVYSICEWGNYAPWTWAGSIGNSWRTTGDIQDTYASMVSNMTSNAALTAYAHPGAYNDPDMLEIGNGGMTDTEYRSEFSLWAEMAAPLIIGTDLRSASAQTLAIYGNKDVIAVDQDSLGKQATLLTSANGQYVFAKALANGDVAVALFNSTGTATTISTTASAAGLSNAHVYTEKNLWTKQTTETAGRISAYVPAHGTVMYRVHAAQGGREIAAALHDAPSTTLTVTSSPTVAAGGSTTATVALTDDGALPVEDTRLSLAVPQGWTARHTKGSQYTVKAPATVSEPISTAELAATATYKDITGAESATSTLGISLYSPVSSSYSTTNTTGTAAVFGQLGDTLAIHAAGSGVHAAQTGFVTSAASDSYGAVYAKGTVSSNSTITTTLTSQTATSGFGSEAASGLMVRNDATASNGSPEGVALYVSGSGSVAMAWAANGGSDVDTSAPTVGPGSQTLSASYPVELKLVRSGTSYTGYYSTDSGTTWTEVATATLPSAAAAATQDAALFHTSGSALAATDAEFTGLSVS